MNTVILAGYITWLITAIIVESELVRPLRDLVYRFTKRGVAERLRREAYEAFLDLDLPTLDVIRDYVNAGPRWHHRLMTKVHYLLACNLCTGVWVGLGLATVLTGPFENIILDGLAYKAIAHFILAVVNFLDGDHAPVVFNVTTIEHEDSVITAREERMMTASEYAANLIGQTS